MNTNSVVALLLLTCSIGSTAHAEEPADSSLTSAAQPPLPQDMRVIVPPAEKPAAAPPVHIINARKRQASVVNSMASEAIAGSDTSSDPLARRTEAGIADATAADRIQVVPAAHKHVALPISEVSAIAASNTPDRNERLLHDIKLTDGLLALFAGLLLLNASLQTRRLRSTVDAVNATARAAEKSAQLAENALVLGQRAFMFIREIRTYYLFDAASDQVRWSIHPVWENSGNTPTRELMINTMYQVADEPLPDGYDFPHAEKDMVPTIAGPKTLVEAAPGSISSDDLTAVQNGTKYFYIWGWAEYRDVFDGTQKHVTRFCNQLTHVIGDTTAPVGEHNPVQMIFSFHAENNYAD